MFLYRRGKVWWLGWTERGKKHRRALHKHLNLPSPIKDKTTANQLMYSIQFRRIKEELGIPVRPNSPPVDDFYAQYFEHCKRIKTANSIRADSYRFQPWLEFLQKHDIIRLSEITPVLFNDFLRPISKGKENATINKYVSVIRASLEWAFRQKYIQENPLKEIPRLPERRIQRRATFKKGDLEKLFSLDDSVFVAYLQVIYYTLMRRSEALNLTWEDVDLRRRTITIQKTKNRIPRTVPIADNLLKTLRGLPRNGDRLFPDWQQHSVTTKFRRLRKKLKLGVESIHHFRHIGASELLRRGVSLGIVQRLLGHTTPQTTLAMYIHTDLDGLKDAVNRM